MHNVEIRPLRDSEIQSSREMVAQNPDFHARYVVSRLPSFFAIARKLDPDSAYLKRQRLNVGAFYTGELIGTASVERVTEKPFSELSDEDNKWFSLAFTEHEVKVYDTLQQSLCKTIIGAPIGSLSIHSLAVSLDNRNQGVARHLLRYIIDSLSERERLLLHIEFAKLKWLQRFGRSLGFKTVRHTFSLSERLEYGCFGSVLMRYQPEDSM
jgi:GNAT superfamily N-acetyltransferase